MNSSHAFTLLLNAALNYYNNDEESCDIDNYGLHNPVEYTDDNNDSKLQTKLA